MDYRWLLYCRTEKKVNCINCAMSPAGLWHDVQQLSLPPVDIGAVFKGSALNYSSFPTALEQGFLFYPKENWRSQPPTPHNF